MRFLVFILVDLDRGDQYLYIGPLLWKIYGGLQQPPLVRYVTNTASLDKAKSL